MLRPNRRDDEIGDTQRAYNSREDGHSAYSGTAEDDIVAIGPGGIGDQPKPILGY